MDYKEIIERAAIKYCLDLYNNDLGDDTDSKILDMQ